jgi:hypothetical protein
MTTIHGPIHGPCRWSLVTRTLSASPHILILLLQVSPPFANRVVDSGRRLSNRLGYYNTLYAMIEP